MAYIFGMTKNANWKFVLSDDDKELKNICYDAYRKPELDPGKAI